MKTIKITILITTLNDGIERVIKNLLPQLKDVYEIIISHQITDKNISPYLEELASNIRYKYIYDKGLSKNRNNALKFASGDICVICDDDLNYIENFDKIIKEAYFNNNFADIITFQAIDEKGNYHGKKIKKIFKHNNISILNVTSWTITFKLNSIREKKIKFDENFGLGTKICVGEENIFLRDSIKKNLNLIYYPKIIVIHPKESSGLNYRDELIKSRPKVFKRMFGFLGYVFSLIYFPIFHYKLYKKKYSFFKFIKISIKK